MAFVNGLGSIQIRNNYEDGNLQLSTFLKAQTFAGYTGGCPIWGIEDPSQGGDQTEIDFITARNVEVTTYWTDQRAMVNRILNWSRNGEEHKELAVFMCNGHDIFANGLYGLPNAVGRQMTTVSTELDFMKAAISAQDLATATILDKPVKPLSDILAKTPSSTVYDKYWSGSDFVPDAAWVTYYQTTSYTDLIDSTRQMGSAT